MHVLLPIQLQKFVIVQFAPLKGMIRMIRQPNPERVDELSNAGTVYLTKREFTRTFCTCFPCLESCSFSINPHKKINKDRH